MLLLPSTLTDEALTTPDAAVVTAPAAAAVPFLCVEGAGLRGGCINPTSVLPPPPVAVATAAPPAAVWFAVVVVAVVVADVAEVGEGAVPFPVTGVVLVTPFPP